MAHPSRSRFVARPVARLGAALAVAWLSACGNPSPSVGGHGATTLATASGSTATTVPAATAPSKTPTAPPSAPAEAPTEAPTEVPSMPTTPSDAPTDLPREDTPRTELATLGAGCFWCVEAVYEQLPGVKGAVSGYMGGTVEDPTYEEVCSKKTGHVEVVQVEFDPAVITYGEVLDWFWRLHDPTSWDRQGADAGPQYRSVIFFHSPEQERVARESLAAAQPSFSKPIVTEVRAAAPFWVAEGYHQGYYFDNTNQGYCRMVIAPKLDKLGLKR